VKRATAIIERILNTGGPAARRTAESLVAGLAAAMLNKGDSAESRSVRQSELRDASAAETTCSDKRVLTLSDAMRRCQAPVRELAECLLDGTAPELAGSHVWALFRKEYSDRLNRGKAEDGIPLTLTGSVSEDAAIERAGIERARISDYVRRGWIATGMSLQTKKDFFAAGDEILQAARRANDSDRVFCVQTDAGTGERQGLLSLVSGSKGRIRLFGRTLSDLAHQSAALASLELPRAPWTIISACDSILFPTVDELAALAAATKQPDHVYLFTPKADVDDAEQPAWMQTAARLGTGLASRFASHWMLGSYVRGPIRGILAVRERIMRQIAGGEDLPAFRILPTDRLRGLFNEYRAASRGGSTGNGEFFWYRRPSTALRASFDQWTLLWDPAAGTALTQWQDYFYRERRWVGDWSPLHFSGDWVNANTPVEVAAMARAVCLEAAPVWQMKLRTAFGLPEQGQVVQSTLPRESIDTTGPHFVWRSRIKVPDGCRCEIGANVVIAGSVLDLAPNKDGEVRIPDGTVIVDSWIEGTVRGSGTDSLIYRVFSDDGIDLQSGEVQASLFLRHGQHIVGRHALEYDPKAINPRTSRRRAEDHLAGGLAHAELATGDLIDADRMEAEVARLAENLHGLS